MTLPPQKTPPAKALGIYVLASVLVAVFARPGYDTLGAIIVLVGGATGSLKLCIEAGQDVSQGDSAPGTGEAFTVCLSAFMIWLLGALLVFKAALANWKGGFLAAGISIWVIAACYNMFWFGIRSL